jgi:hypothetical protein
MMRRHEFLMTRRPEFLMMRRPEILMMRRPEFLMMRRPCAALCRPENPGRTASTGCIKKNATSEFPKKSTLF